MVVYVCTFVCFRLRVHMRFCMRVCLNVAAIWHLQIQQRSAAALSQRGCSKLAAHPAGKFPTLLAFG